MTSHQSSESIEDAIFGGGTRTRSGVVVTAMHPTVGPVYWHFVDESSVGGPNYRSLTTSIDKALLLDAGWRVEKYFYHRDHMANVLRDRDQIQEGQGHDEEFGEWSFIDLGGGVGEIHRKSGQTEADFLVWLRDAVWVDVPGPTRIETLVDDGYSYSWEVVKD